MLTDTTSPKRALDPRPARTRAAILSAIERLGLRGAELNIGTVVAEAGLSRSSFYSQFKDLGDVVVQLFQGLQGQVIALEAERFDRVNSPEGAMASYRLITAELQRHRGLYSAVLSSTTTSMTHTLLCRAIARMIQAPTQKAAPPGTDAETAALYIAAGSLAVLIIWLHSDEPVSEAEIHRQLVSLLPPWIISDPSDT